MPLSQRVSFIPIIILHYGSIMRPKGTKKAIEERVSFPAFKK